MTALAELRPKHKYFTVVDLANAFFRLPVAPELQPVFAFTYNNRQYTYNRMPQGFSLTPGIYNAII